MLRTTRGGGRLVKARHSCRLLRRAHLARDDRGAVVVEFALLLIVFLTFISGIVDVGFNYQHKLGVQSVVRAATRIAAANGNRNLADYQALQAVGNSLSFIPITSLDGVVIYKSTTLNEEVPSACIPAETAEMVSGGVEGVCNVYDREDIQQAMTANFFGWFAFFQRQEWAPSERLSENGHSSEYVGVWIRTKNRAFVGLFGREHTVTDRSVMQLEGRSDEEPLPDPPPPGQPDDEDDDEGPINLPPDNNA